MSSENNSVDRNFTFSLNVSGISAANGNPTMTEGYYTATITDAFVDTSRNASRVQFKLTVSDGPLKGVVRTDGLNIPKSADDKVRYYWRALCESAGFTSAQLDNGEVSIGPDTFKGKDVYIHYIPKGSPNNSTEYDRVVYLNQTDWKARAAAANPASAGNGSALGAANAAAPQAAASGNAVMAKLGLTL